MFEKVKDTIAVYTLEKNLTLMLYRLVIALIVLVIVLVIAIFSLFPLKEKVPYLVQWTNSELNFATVQKADENVQSNYSIRKNLVGTYVINRETKNNIDDSIRMEKVRLQSSFSVWNDLQKIVKAQGSIYKDSSLTREVKIINISFIPNANIAQVDFQTIDKIENSSEITAHNLRAIIRFTFEDMQMKFEEQPLNPLTFKITSYDISDLTVLKEQR
jgi:type IV secretory pathway component VirB8